MSFKSIHVILNTEYYGWEVVCCYKTRKEAKEDLKLYQENEPEYTHKIVKKRIKL